jgi:hypothetical protein
MFDMKHALAKINFEVRLDAADMGTPFTVEVTSLTVRNVIGRGTLDLSKRPTDATLWTTTAPASAADLASYTITPGWMGGLNELVLEADNEDPTAPQWSFSPMLRDGQYLMLIPQSLDGKGIDCPAEVVVEYNVTNTENGTVTEGKQLVLPLARTDSEKLTPGKGTTYRITISPADYPFELPEIPDEVPNGGTAVSPQPYVGAFWRDRESGERLITIPIESPAAAGNWVVRVFDYGDEFVKGDIVFSTTPSLDANANNRPGATVGEPGNAQNYRVTDGGRMALGTVVGSVDPAADVSTTNPGEIFFRIGLNTSRQHLGYVKPRYAVAILSYGGQEDGTGWKHQLIWLRQGEWPDYLMRPEDGSGARANLTSRPLARMFSAFNLTATLFNDAVASAGVNSAHVGTKGGDFTQFPTQTGAYFQWAPRDSSGNPSLWAYTPASGTKGYIFQGWVSSNNIIGFWDDLKAEYETCPTTGGMDYRRPSDGATNDFDLNVSTANSELHQSLIYNINASTTSQYAAYDLQSNSAWGFYADGFFDRRPRGTQGHYPYARPAPSNTAVAANTPAVAMIGRVFFNPISNNSVFFPASGGHTTAPDGGLGFTGENGYYWTSTLEASWSGGWLLSFYNGVNGNRGSNALACAYPIRCVVD